MTSWQVYEVHVVVIYLLIDCYEVVRVLLFAHRVALFVGTVYENVKKCVVSLRRCYVMY